MGTVSRVFGYQNLQAAANQFGSVAQERKPAGRNRDLRAFYRYFESREELRFVKQQHLAYRRIGEARFEQNGKPAVLPRVGA
ncbi:MAG: hypothetical protein ABI604_04810 [Nitrospirota bacterium]